MIDINRWVTYLVLAAIAILGVAVVTGLVYDFDLKTRFVIGGLVIVYVVVRALMLRSRRQPRSLIGSSREEGNTGDGRSEKA